MFAEHHPVMIKRIWITFVHELLNSVDLCENAK